MEAFEPRERERERDTHTHTTSHNIKSHQDKCMSNLNLRAKKTYKKDIPQAQSAQAEPTYRRPFSLASRKDPLNPFFLTEATTDRKAASAISQTPQCCAQPSLPRARSLSLSLSLSLSRSLSRCPWSSIRVHTTVPPVHSLASSLVVVFRWASCLLNEDNE